MAKDQELLQAVKAKDLSSVRKLLTKIKAAMSKKGGKKYNVNIQDEDGFTVLHHVALAGIPDVTMSLIDMGSNINATDKKGMCPLHLAAWSGKVEVARLLLEAKADPNFCSDNGGTALQLACQHGNVNVAEVLLDNGADPTVINNSGEACLDLACRFGHTQVAELLLKSSSVRKLLNLYSINPNNSQPPLHLACKTGHVEIVRMLLEAGADMNEVDESGSCLHEAALYGKTEVVKLLLDWGIDTTAINKENLTAEEVVHRFTSSGASKVIKELLKEVTENKGTFAKATKDHMNFYDPACLIFRVGNTIEVLEQNENGRWKGRVQGEDKVGYFPANFVKLQSPKKRSSTRSSTKEVAVLPTGSFELVALTPVPASHGFQRNSPRLSSFGKVQPKSPSSSSLSERPASAEREPDANANRPPTVNGIKQKGSVKQPAQTLQYIEVAVDPNSPTAVVQGAPFAYDTSGKTQYAEVILREPAGSANGDVEEVDPLDEPPELPGKQGRDAVEDSVWVRNPDLPTLPPKARARSKTPDNVRPSVAPPVSHATGSQPARVSTPEAIKREARKPATPELSRKAYELMSSPSTAAPSPQISRNSDTESIPRIIPAKTVQYENVEIKARTPQAQSMIITDVDRGASEEYVEVNQRSYTVGAPGYENVLPSGLPIAKKHSYENVPVGNLARSESYENMGDAQLPRLENDKRQSAESQLQAQSENAGEQDDGSEGREYVTMKRGADGPHHYVNLKADGMPSENPAAAKGTVTLSMRDYNVLYDWLERNKLVLYVDNFVKGGFDIVSVRGITPEDLSAIDVVKTGHRKKILSEAATLEESDVFPKEKPPTIEKWLQLIGMEQYVPQFLDGGFDDMDFVQDVTVEDLDTIGVTKPGHRRKLWMAVNALARDPRPAAQVDDKRNEDARSEALKEEAPGVEQGTTGPLRQETDERGGVCESSGCPDPQQETPAANLESSIPGLGAPTSGTSLPELDCYTGSSDDLYSSSSSNISVIEVTKPGPSAELTEDTQAGQEAVQVPPLSFGNPWVSNEAVPTQRCTSDDAVKLQDSGLKTAAMEDNSEKLAGDRAGVEDRAGSEGDRAGSEGNRAVSDDDRAGSERSRAVSGDDRAGSEGNRALSEGSRAVSEDDRARSEENGAVSEGFRAESEGDRAVSGGDENQLVQLVPAELKTQNTETTVGNFQNIEPATNNNNTLIDVGSTVVQEREAHETSEVREAVIGAPQAVCRETRVKSAPPPVKPKSFKKPPPRVPPKPRSGSSRGASFSGQTTCPAPGAETDDVAGNSPQHGRNRSAGSDPSGFSPAPLPSHQNGTDCRGRSESTSSRSSVESIIEEFEERRKSLERIRPTSRKHSAPDVMPRRWSQGPGESMSVGGGGELGKQIKNILRRKSTEELTSFHSGPSADFGSEGSAFTSEGGELEKGGEKEKDLGDDLINDINNLLSDISTELDAIC